VICLVLGGGLLDSLLCRDYRKSRRGGLYRPWIPFFAFFAAFAALVALPDLVALVTSAAAFGSVSVAAANSVRTP
jgi:hypothetical protein